MNPSVAEAAKTVVYVLEGYGNLLAMQYDRETGMIRNLCQDLQGQYAEAVATLKLTEVVENLRATNEEFSNRLVNRDESNAGFLKNEMLAARKTTDAAYYQFVEILNSLSILAERQHGFAGNPYRQFVEWLNAYIDRLKREALKQRVRTESAEPATAGQPGWENPGDGTDPDYPTEPGEGQTPPTENEPTTPGGGENTNPGNGGGSTAERYTITYMHGNQVYTTQEVEVGASVTPPEPPTGYIWLNVPSRMPGRNVTCESYEDDDPNNI